MRLELLDATKKYGSTKALDSATVQIQPGELVAVLGLNGAGKSTLLRALAGMLTLNRGELLFDGEPFRRENLEMRRNLFFLPDRPAMFWHMDVLRNVGVYLRQHRREKTEGMAERVAQLFEAFDLLERIDAWPEELSRGQIYKCGLVALCAVDPPVWLLDEPFASGMDAHGLEQFRVEARRARDGGGTVVYSTQLYQLQRMSWRFHALRSFFALPAMFAIGLFTAWKFGHPPGDGIRITLMSAAAWVAMQPIFLAMRYGRQLPIGLGTIWAWIFWVILGLTSVCVGGAVVGLLCHNWITGLATVATMCLLAQGVAWWLRFRFDRRGFDLFGQSHRRILLPRPRKS